MRGLRERITALTSLGDSVLDTAGTEIEKTEKEAPNEKAKASEDPESEEVEIDDWLFGFTQLFRTHVGIDPDAHIDAYEFGMELCSEALEETVTSEEAQSLFVKAAPKFQECSGVICGAGMKKGFQGHDFEMLDGGINVATFGYPKLARLGAEIVGTVILVYSVLSAANAKSNIRDSHVSILAPLSIEFAVLLVHPAVIPITRTGIKPTRSLGPPSSTTREMPGMICGFPGLDPSLELL